MRDRIELVGLDVYKKYLKPGKYLIATCTSEEDSFYTPYWWSFRLKGNLQLIGGSLADDGEYFGALADDRHWNIYWEQGHSNGVRAFTDIWVYEKREEE